MNLQSQRSSLQKLKALVASLLLALSAFPSGSVVAADSGSNDAFELHGAITKLPGTANFVGDWAVGDKVVHVAATTIIEQEHGAVAVGAYVEIKGTPNSDGSLTATKVEVQLPVGNPGGAEAIEFTGNIEELPSTTGRIGDWKVAGKVVHVSATTFIKQERTQVAAGVTVEVTGLQQSNGSVIALKIETRSNTSGEAKFTGKIEELPSAANRVGAWKVSGRVIHVSAATVLKQDDSAIAIGAIVKVEGIAQADGSLNATQIETKSSSTSEQREVSLRGTVEALPAATTQIGAWRVSGRTIHVTANTILRREYGPAVLGSIVEVEGYVQPDNSIDAKKVEVESQPSAPVRNTPGYCRFFGPIKSLPNMTGWIGEWNVGGHKLNVVAATVINQERGSVVVGALVEVLAVAKAGALEAVRVEVKSGVGNSAGYVKFFGTISALPAATNFVGDWTVGSKVAHVTSSTRLKQERGKIVINAFVEVEGNQRSDGSVDATSVEVKRDGIAGNGNTGFVSFYDTIKSVPSTPGFIGDWTIGSKTVHVANTTVIDQERGQVVVVGALVEVKGQQKADGSIDAAKIEVKGIVAGGAGATFIEIVGAITSLPNTTNLVGDWKVDGRTIRVTTATLINREHGTPAVGLIVEVKGQMQADGSIDARTIEVKRSSNFTALNRLTSVNAGGYQPENSPEAIIASFGSNLATTTANATSLPLPTSLAGISVLVDGKPAQLFFVSPTQINYLVPASASLGVAKVEVVRVDRVLAQGAITLPGVSPSFFTANSDGKGVPAGYVTRVKADHSMSNEQINRYDDSQRKFVATPIVKKSGESLFLILYGTGFRTAPDADGNSANGVAENVEVTIGGVKAEVSYAGLSGFVGVEQINIKLPSDVPTGANVTVMVKVNDGQGNVIRTNETTIAIQ
ncbi:MAG TPA: DUF5666 domain-containing protein [Blastocatellia bacterium]|nr:DUF5666 domain-containing protein [Blastocatellia bacterium]